MHTVGLPRTCLGFTNVLCFILAFISFVICAWCAINTEFFEEVNYTVTKSQSVRTIAKFMNLKVWITPITTILMPVGVVAMLTSCCGLLGAGCKVKCAIKSYIFLVSVLSLVGFWLFIISGLYNIYTNNEKTARYMQGSIRHYYGKEDDFFTYIWNYTMVNHECCGAVSYRDFSKSVWRENNPDKLFPVQCCTLANTSSLEPVSKKCNTDEEDEHSHKEIGCMHALRKSIKINKGKIIFYLILLAVLYLVLMLFSYCIIKGEPLLGAMATGFANVLNPKPREETQVIQSRTSLENMIFVEEPPKKVMRVVSTANPFQTYTFAPNSYSVK
ncbi:tetraspanin-1 [Bombyx mori]|uniref:Tetraspanin n=1 Tax=Bombyx mori TaxID=7091 RepID=A0A8R1WEI8_BOMMO|nr:tetraspanin-1 [Bombyx mori]